MKDMSAELAQARHAQTQQEVRHFDDTNHLTPKQKAEKKRKRKQAKASRKKQR